MTTTTPLPIDETSQSLGSGSEVTMLMPIKPGFVPYRDTVTYALRLRRVLRMFNALRKTSLEVTPHDTIVGAVERIQTVTSFNWAVVENQTKLLLNVVFDRPWEPYIRKIARDAGPMLDLILCNCAGYVEGSYSTENGYPKFAEWVRKHQTGVDFLYTSHAQSTIDDQSYYEQLDQLLHDPRTPGNFDLAAATLRARSPSERAEKRATDNPDSYVAQLVAVICAFHAMREFFPGVAKPFPAAGAGDSRDQWFLKHAAHALLGKLSPDVVKRLEGACPAEYDWFRQFDEPLPPTVAHELPKPSNVQGNILQAYEGMMHGALLLIRLGDSREQSFEYLKKLSETITTAESNPPAEARNLFFTIDGLRRLGLRADWIAKLPKEFRDGMEARAGLLGDVRNNHPRNWVLPTANGPLLNGAKFRVPLQSVDIAVLLQRTDASLEQSIDEIASQAAQYGAGVLYVESMYKSPSGAEHFGFKDGISDPVPPGTAPPASAYSDQVPLGEFLLGYPNRHDDRVDAVDPLLKDGSYMVVRKLLKNTKAFGELKYPVDAKLAKAKLMGRDVDGKPLVKGDAATKVTNDFDFHEDPTGALCPFQSHIRRANPRCPADGSPAVPRIARRGFSYGPAPDSTAEGERGAMFMAYNASIAEQFEIIQRWMSGGNSTGIASRGGDPLLGLPKPGESRSMRFQHGGKVYRIDLGSEPLVKLKWGLYLFCPSISLIGEIAAGALQEDPKKRMAAIEAEGARTIMSLNMPSPDTAIPLGASKEVIAARMVEIIAALSKEVRTILSVELKTDIAALSATDIAALSATDIAAFSKAVIDARTAEVIAFRWKNFLESDLGPRASLVNAVWAAIRKDHKGVLRTPYGTLVAGAEQVKAVLADDGKLFSVRENWDRMQGSIVETYLGFDRCPAHMQQPLPGSPDEDLDKRYLAACPPGSTRFDTESGLSKPRMAEVTFETARKESLRFAEAWLDEQLKRSTLIRIPELFGVVLAKLAEQWFGMPDGAQMVASAIPEGGEQQAACPFHFFAVSKYVFPPRPIRFVKEQASDHGRLIREAALSFVEEALQQGSAPGELLSEVYKVKPEVYKTKKAEFISRTIITLLNGFVAPTFANFLTIMNRWIESRDLAREYHRYMLNPGSSAGLESTIKQALLVKCTPSTVNRTVVSETTLPGWDLKFKPGEQLVVGLQSAVDERRSTGDYDGGLEFVFGGNYRSSPALIHACPGQAMAIGVMAGTLKAIFDAHLIADTGMPLTLRRNSP